MHPDSIKFMRSMLGRIRRDEVASVLDVGSLDVNGSYRELIEGMGWRYIGLDVRNGKNVDIVSEDPFRFPFPDGAFDVVISGSTMEHVTHPWLWIPELARVLRVGGLLAIVTHWSFEEHRYPLDCYRYLPDGMHTLLDLPGTLGRYDIRIASATDITASAIKVSE